jgi:hypothetical protein
MHDAALGASRRRHYVVANAGCAQAQAVKRGHFRRRGSSLVFMCVGQARGAVADDNTWLIAEGL